MLADGYVLSFHMHIQVSMYSTRAWSFASADGQNVEEDSSINSYGDRWSNTQKVRTQVMKFEGFNTTATKQVTCSR